MVIKGGAVMHISLTPKLEEIVKEKVSSGLYNNSSEVVREALRLMQKNDQLYRFKLDRLREEIAKGIDAAERGEYTEMTVDEIMAEAKSEKYGK